MTKIAIVDSGVDTPEEILMAADITPVRFFGDPSLNITKANEHVPPNHCIWARNLLERALNGLDADIKGIITTHGCDCTNREFDIWLECVDLDFMYFLNTPLKRDKAAVKFFIDDMKELIEQIEDKFNVKITPEKITEAIKLTNEIRNLLKEISEFRSKMVLKGSEFHEIVKKVQQEDKQQILAMLKNKLEELKSKEPFSDKMKRILLTGSVIDDSEFIKNLETLGLQVVIDDLCIGTRYFWDSIEENGDPIKALSKYHLTKPIYSTKIPSLQRLDHLKEYAEKYDVDGVLNIAQKFCEPILYDHPHISKEFKALGIPYLFVEIEYSRESFKQLATRFEAFAEMIGGK